MTSAPNSHSWRSETRKYAPRFEALPVCVDDALSSISQLGVTAPLDASHGVKNIVMTQLVLFNTGCLRVAYDITKAAELLFHAGRITSTCLQIRLLYEFWGASAFASTLCDRVRDSNDLGNASALECIITPVGRLIGGSRSPVRLPRGGQTSLTSFNVLTFIDHLEKRQTGTKEEYHFLCESCHPSFIQNSYFWMAGIEGDNWANDLFGGHARNLLERLIGAGERAAGGLADAAERISVTAKPFVGSSA